MEFFKNILKPKIEKGEQEMEKQIIESTAGFRKAIESGNLEEAEAWIDKIKSERETFPQYDDRWVDHRERELFQVYYKKEDWAGAKKIVKNSINQTSREGRTMRLEELSGMKFDEII